MCIISSWHWSVHLNLWASSSQLRLQSLWGLSSLAPSLCPSSFWKALRFSEFLWKDWNLKQTLPLHCSWKCLNWNNPPQLKRKTSSYLKFGGGGEYFLVPSLNNEMNRKQIPGESNPQGQDPRALILRGGGVKVKVKAQGLRRWFQQKCCFPNLDMFLSEPFMILHLFFTFLYYYSSDLKSGGGGD